MKILLVSACLLGENCKYDGGNNLFPFLEEIRKYYDIIPFCPEVEGGLKTPRSPSEIVGGSVKTKNGKDVTRNFNLGAEKAVNICKYYNIEVAILKEGSPSCGARKIYDGSFKGNKIDGQGITAARLSSIGVRVYSEQDDLSFLIPSPKEEKEITPYVASKPAEEKTYKPKPQKKEYQKPKNKTFSRGKPFKSNRRGK